MLDSSLRLVWMNEAYLRVTMRTRDELLGQRMFDAFPSDPHSESHRLLKGSLERVLATGEADELALVRYDIRNADGTMDIRFWSATHTPLRDAQGGVAWILQHTVDVTELEGLRRLRDEMGVVQRASAVQQRNRSLVEETDQLRSLFEQAPGFIAILQGLELRFVIANAAYRALVGRRDLIGLPLAQALPEVVDQGFAGLLDQVLRSGEPFVGRRVKVMLENAPEQHEERYLDFIYQPIVARDGQVSGIFVQGHDVTEEVEAEERQKLLINELNHRVKNTLAVVQGLAMQSFRSLPGAQEARVTFDARLNALAAAHSLLTDRNWESAGLVDTLRSSVEATTGSDIDRIAMDGPDVLLRPQTAVSLAMVLHELSTNAIKYGALSDPAGRVEICWSIEQRGERHELTLDWAERGGPRVEAPQRQGFGSRLIRNGMSSEAGNSVELEFRPAGVHCRIRALLPVAAS